MPTPSSGAISFSDIAWIVYNSNTALISLNDSDVRYLLGVNSGTISMSSAYNKPTAGNTGTTYNTPGSYTWVVVPYQTLTATVKGAGGAGGGYYGGQVFFGCVNLCNGSDGSNGAQSSFNGVIAYGGTGGKCCGGTPTVGASGGNNLNANLGGGGAGGLGNTNPVDTNCNQSSGRNGGAGGNVVKTWTKGVDGPAYGPLGARTNISFSVGAGGTSTGGCRGQAGGPGGSGSVLISWS